MKKEDFETIFALILLFTGIFLCWKWYGWKLITVLILLFWSNNISLHLQLRSKVSEWLKGL
jgi:hypothetical protein